jgi:hypothetical protein
MYMYDSWIYMVVGSAGHPHTNSAWGMQQLLPLRSFLGMLLKQVPLLGTLTKSS